MVEKADVKPESLLNLEDLLQCPVCYEIPSGQIFQCNEGHHVCGRCKMRLDVCPVCRALFFGTRNYAMEELISNFRKLKTLKSGGASTSGSSESSTPAKDKDSEEPENDENDNEEEAVVPSVQQPTRTPQSSKGLFRCLCCKNGNHERLPAARLLNHLRYYHRPDLLEGRTENGEYLQAWQISTTPGRLVTAIRIANMGIFFLIIEISSDSLLAWLSMAATPWVAHAFNYTITICGNDREAIFSDCVWSVRSCEGSLKKRGHCLLVRNLDAQALIAPPSISTKLCIRRTPEDQLANQTQPRAVLRIANRVNNDNAPRGLQHFDNNVTRVTRSLATFNREANALAVNGNEVNQAPDNARDEEQARPQNRAFDDEHSTLSRSARRRLRQRLRAALNGPAGQPIMAPPTRPQERIHEIERQMEEIRNAFGLSRVGPDGRQIPLSQSLREYIMPSSMRLALARPPAPAGDVAPPTLRAAIGLPPRPAPIVPLGPPSPRTARSLAALHAVAGPPLPPHIVASLPPRSAPVALPRTYPIVEPTPVVAPEHSPEPARERGAGGRAPQPSVSSPSNGQVQNGNGNRTHKKKRRHRR